MFSFCPLFWPRQQQEEGRKEGIAQLLFISLTNFQLQTLLSKNMSSDDDVIELGADGTFDIPSPPKNSRRDTANKLDQITSEEDPAASFVPPQISLSDEILAKIQPGEYRVYQHKDKGSKKQQQHVVVVHLLASQKPEVKAYASHITVSCPDSTSALKIDISKLNVDVSTTHVQHWNDFLTIRLSK